MAPKKVNKFNTCLSKMSQFTVLIMLSTLVLCVIVGSSAGRSPWGPWNKEVVCPHALSLQICWNTCIYDHDCPEDIMCCRTECGGRVCTRPLTLADGSSTRRPITTPGQKDGACPVSLSLQICWNTCDTDNDCPEVNKCCRTECGGHVCSSPIEAPKNPLAEITYGAYLKHIGGLHCSMAGVCWIRSFCKWIENAGSKPSNCV